MENECISKQMLENECKQFRKAIKCNKMNLGLEWFEKFPACSCGDTALLLGKYLEEKGFGVALNVSGKKGQQSHAWLELDDIYIDITADQFIEIDKSVIITKRSPFHEKFRHIQKWCCNELIMNR